MTDLTLIYYTDNSMDEDVAKRIREYALEVTQNKYPVVSVSQKPIDFGENICIGEVGKSKYNLWKQVLIAAQAAKTKYVACIEDDTLYSPDYFTYRPADDVISYEGNYWFVQPGGRDYYWRLGKKYQLGGQFGCISNRQLIVDNLAVRYSMYTKDPYLDPNYMSRVRRHDRVHFGEPGRNYDRQYKIYDSKSEVFFSNNPCVVFIHTKSLGFRGFTKHHLKKYGYPTVENTAVYLPQFGTPKDIFDRFWRGNKSNVN